MTSNFLPIIIMFHRLHLILIPITTDFLNSNKISIIKVGRIIRIQTLNQLWNQSKK